MILVNIDRDSPEPLYNQIAGQIQLMIEEGRLTPGDILPSTRQLSEHLSLNRTTVSKAYETLWALGYTESQSGAYTRVRKREALHSGAVSLDSGSIIDWNSRLNPGSQKMIQKMTDVRLPPVEGELIDLCTISPAPGLWPFDDFRKCISQAALNHAPEIYGYSDPAGYLPLRQSLAGYLREHQINTSAEEIVITSGAQAAIDLVFRSLLKEGDCIIAEDPTYGYIMPLAEYYNCRIIPINMKEDGMDLSLLEETLKNEKPALIYTMPNFQNPTGITSSQTHREKLLSLCEEFGIPLLEDGFVEELKYSGKTILPIKSMDKKGIVIYVGTFSKVLFPGLRTGWISASKDYTEKLAILKNGSELCGNNLTQEAFRRFIDTGLFEKYVRKIHGCYKNKMNTAMKAARGHLNQRGISFTRPDGGYTFWVTVEDPKRTESDLLRTFKKKGVAVSPGSKYFSSDNNNLNFRVSIAKSEPADIERGIEIIGKVLRSENANQEKYNVTG